MTTVVVHVVEDGIAQCGAVPAEGATALRANTERVACEDCLRSYWGDLVISD